MSLQKRQEGMVGEAGTKPGHGVGQQRLVEDLLRLAGWGLQIGALVMGWCGGQRVKAMQTATV